MVFPDQDFDLCGAHEADSEGIVNYALEVAGVEAAVFLRQHGEGYKVSLRSSGRYATLPHVSNPIFTPVERTRS